MYYFIVNTHARTGKAAIVWNEVKAVLRKHSVDYKAYETSFEGHATELAKKLSMLPDEKVYIVILGGDGTINEVINGIQDFQKVRLGVIPTGSGNDFARGLNIKGTTEEIVLDILNHKEGTFIDIGKVSWNDKSKERLFAISSGVGFDADVCKKSLTSRLKRILNALHMGKLVYILLTIQSLFSLKPFRATVELKSFDNCSFDNVIFGAAMNLKAEGGGVPMAPSADACDGLIPFCIASDIPTIILPYCLVLLVLGKHEKLKYFHQYNDVACHIHTETPVVLHADGEYLADIKDVWYECLPHKVEVLNTINKKEI